jgi:hypothetical protein
MWEVLLTFFPLVETRGYKMIDAVYSPTKKDVGNGQGLKPASDLLK